MGKVIVLISTTPDGFADSQNVIIDQEFFAFTHSLLAKSEVALFGRKTFELFQERWEQRLDDDNSPEWIRHMARTLHNMQKIVFSSSLKKATWNNSEVVDKLDPDHFRSLKDSTNGGLITFGSISIVESLIAMDVVDDFYFNIQPLIPGNGSARLFNTRHLGMPAALEYVDHQHLDSGAHIIHYKCKRPQGVGL